MKYTRNYRDIWNMFTIYIFVPHHSKFFAAWQDTISETPFTRGYIRFRPLRSDEYKREREWQMAGDKASASALN